MRILIVSAGPLNRQIGGGQAYVQDLAMGLRDKGHKVFVLEPGGAATSPSIEITEWQWQGIPVYSLPLPLPGESLRDQLTELGRERIDWIKKLLMRLAPDVVQINGMMPSLVGACRELGLRHVVVAHHPGEVCPKGDLLRPDDSICTLRPCCAVRNLALASAGCLRLFRCPSIAYSAAFSRPAIPWVTWGGCCGYPGRFNKSWWALPAISRMLNGS